MGSSSEQDERIKAKDEGWGIKRILAPVDFSEASLVGLDYAIAIGDRFNAEVVLVFVVEPLRYAGDRQLLLADERRFGRRELSRLERRLGERGLMHRTVLQVGTPYQVIVEEAQKCGADLIVMATHGRTGLSHLLLGSVAEKVIRSARCPVLTVPSVKRVASTPEESYDRRRDRGTSNTPLTSRSRATIPRPTCPMAGAGDRVPATGVLQRSVLPSASWSSSSHTLARFATPLPLPGVVSVSMKLVSMPL